MAMEMNSIAQIKMAKGLLLINGRKVLTSKKDVGVVEEVAGQASQAFIIRILNRMRRRSSKRYGRE
jgi:rRNA processing protein Gar1